jgi:beta-glucosidase
LNDGARAIADGVPIEAYFHWSFIDNFEWAHAYKHRFGLIFCDYENGGARTLKDSARWYAEVIRSNGASLGQR